MCVWDLEIFGSFGTKCDIVDGKEDSTNIAPRAYLAWSFRPHVVSELPDMEPFLKIDQTGRILGEGLGRSI